MCSVFTPADEKHATNVIDPTPWGLLYSDINSSQLRLTIGRWIPTIDLPVNDAARLGVYGCWRSSSRSTTLIAETSDEFGDRPVDGLDSPYHIWT